MARVFPEDSPVLDPNNVPESLDKIERYLRYIQERVEHMNYAQGKTDERQQEELALVVSRAGTSVEINDQAIQTAAGYEGLNTRITQNANSISSIVQSVGSNGTVTAASIVQAVNSAGSTVKISADHITLSGDVVLKSNLTDNTTQISGGNIKTGTIASPNGKYSLNMTTGEVNMASANITGGHIFIETQGVEGDLIKLKYGDNYVAMGPGAGYEILDAAYSNYKTRTLFDGNQIRVLRESGSTSNEMLKLDYGSSAPGVFSMYGANQSTGARNGYVQLSPYDGLMIKYASNTTSNYDVELSSDYLFFPRGTSILYKNPSDNAKLLGSTTSSSWTTVSVGSRMARYRAFVLVACRSAVGGGRGAMASTYIPYELARLCTSTSYESHVTSAQNSIYAGRCYFDFTNNRIYIISSGNADCVIKIYGIT